jgi:hypothetical protein
MNKNGDLRLSAACSRSLAQIMAERLANLGHVTLTYLQVKLTTWLFSAALAVALAAALAAPTVPSSA